MKRILYFLVFFLAGTGNVVFADTTMTVTSLDYQIYLPDNWIKSVVNDSQHIFYDTTATTTALISLVRYHINRSTFPAANDWQRASFIASMLVAEYSYDPWGAVLYYDSSATSKQQNYWAPEIYTEYFTTDTSLDSWSEYVRYTSTASYGYELYAIGDTLDIAENIGLYAGIIRMIQLEISKTIIVHSNEPKPHRFSSLNREAVPYLYTVTGRKIACAGSRGRLETLPVGVYCAPGQKRTRIIK
jgi:hypothetical protein